MLLVAPYCLVNKRQVEADAAVVFVVGAFPWLTPQWWNVLAGGTLAVWGALLVLLHGQQSHAP